MARNVATISSPLAASLAFHYEANPERSVDETSLEPGQGGSVVTYDAERSKGPLHVFAVALGAIFRRLGDEASRGLRRALRSLEVV